MEYSLKPPGRECAATGQPLSPGTRCVSVLVEREGEYQRLDYSEDAWPGPPEGAIGYWRCVVPDESPKQPGIDTDGLMQLFEQLGEVPNHAQEKLRYVLALLLIRKRRLKLDENRHDDEGEILVLSGMQGEGPYEIRGQQLKDEEIEELQKQLNGRMGHQEVAR